MACGYLILTALQIDTTASPVTITVDRQVLDMGKGKCNTFYFDILARSLTDTNTDPVVITSSGATWNLVSDCSNNRLRYDQLVRMAHRCIDRTGCRDAVLRLKCFASSDPQQVNVMGCIPPTSVTPAVTTA